MSDWENFEYVNQLLLAPLLADTRQYEAFWATVELHDALFIDTVCRLLEPTHFFEIGAHEATASRTVAERLPGCTCHAFEADSDVYAHFQVEPSITQHDNLHYHHLAVGDKNEPITFYKQVSYHGQQIEQVTWNNSLRKKNDDIDYREIRVLCTTMDNFAQKQGPIERAVLRIDVEGLCYEVILGSQQLLKNTVAIYAEVEDYEIWSGQHTVSDVHQLLARFDFVPISRDVETPGQYNILWVRRRTSMERAFRANLAMYYDKLLRVAARCNASR